MGRGGWPWRTLSTLGFTELPFTELPYNGIMLDAKRIESQAQLSAALARFKDQQKNAAWMRVDSSNLNALDSALQLGFEMHHVNREENQLVLYKWLPDPEVKPDKVPAWATHQVGVGGLVLNPANELLLVKERHSARKMWKLPGGMLDLGEDFGQGARREVLEETGVAAEFQSILGFWQRHDLRPFSQSDIYAVVYLRAPGDQIQIDNEEIVEAKWMNLQDYRETEKHPLILSVLRGLFPEEPATQGVPSMEMRINEIPAPGGKTKSFSFYMPEMNNLKVVS